MAAASLDPVACSLHFQGQRFGSLTLDTQLLNDEINTGCFNAGKIIALASTADHADSHVNLAYLQETPHQCHVGLFIRAQAVSNKSVNKVRALAGCRLWKHAWIMHV